MANYTKATDFAAKDGLTSGDPAKIVKGAEIDDEFNAIVTAVNSKANTNSPAFTGIPTAPTATNATHSTQLATTAFVHNSIYPVGSIYINASDSTNPATLFGFGTWEAFGAGRVPVGFDSEDTLFDAAEETGGSKDAIVVSHTHAVTDPGHRHETETIKRSEYDTSGGAAGYGQDSPTGTGPDVNTTTKTTGISIQSTGSSGTNANLQPYITVYMWKRTA